MNKEHIISEIKRTAELNDGSPLGTQKFEAETGIKTRDWYGKFWVKWGDALKEAGFEPNNLQGAYTDEYLLNKLCEFIRELEHFPVTGELMIKHQKDPDFPSKNTFGKWGRKHKLVAKVIEHSKKRGWDDIIAICQNVPLKEDKPTTKSKQSVFTGFVYLARFGNHFKIGRTNSTGRRERELAIQLPEKLDIIHSIKTDDPVGIEAYWHNRFKDKRGNGEWFELNVSDISTFKRRKFM